MSNKSTIVRSIQIAAGVGSAIAPRLAARVLARRFLTTTRRPMPTRERRWMETARHDALPLDDGRVVPLHHWGRSDGPTVLLVHGWSGRGSQLAVLAAPLVARGMHVVTYDAPGHGAASGRRSSLPELAAVVQRVAARLGPLHAIVAHSLGAAATTLAVSRGTIVSRLVYLAPPEEPGQYLGRAARAFGFSERVVARAQARLERDLGLPFAMVKGSTLAASLTIPLRVIHDREDREVPYEEGARLVRAWSGAELVTTHGLGHHRIVRDRAVVAATIGFVLAGPTTSHAHVQAAV